MSNCAYRIMRGWTLRLQKERLKAVCKEQDDLLRTELVLEELGGE
jgi:hypothetical protein